MAAIPSSSSTLQTGSQVHYLNEQRNADNMEVARALLQYRPFQEIVTQAGMNPGAVQGLGVEIDQRTHNLVLTFYSDQNDPATYRSLIVFESDGKIFEAAAFLRGLINQKPTFEEGEEVPPADPPPSDTRPPATASPSSSPPDRSPPHIDPPPSAHSTSTSPADLAQRLTAANGQGQDALLTTVVQIFKEFTETQKAQATENRKGIEALSQAIGRLGENMHCYRHGGETPPHRHDGDNPKLTSQEKSERAKRNWARFTRALNEGNLREQVADRFAERANRRRLLTAAFQALRNHAVQKKNERTPRRDQLC